MPYACVTAFSIDTADGERFLPLFSDNGISSIIRKDKRFTLTYGSQCPNFSSGRVYMSQLINGDVSNPESGETIFDKMYYGYIADDDLNSVTEVEYTHIAKAVAAGTLKEVDAQTLGKTSLGNIPAYAFAFVAVPDGYTVTKDSGIGTKVPFELNNSIAGSGANAYEKYINGATMFIYGELKLSATELFFYVDKK